MNLVTSLYVHVPFCRHLCNYCDFYKQKWVAPSAQREEFASYLQASWKRHESIMAEQKVSWGEIDSMYLGGGTPSLWDVEGAHTFAHLTQKLIFSSDAEVTFEIDPGAWSEQGLVAWESFGVNRYSVGTQAFDEEYLKILDRAHDLRETTQLLERLSGKNFSVDFLLGSPESSRARDVISELEKLLAFSPKHLSLYILQPAAGYKLKTKIPADQRVAEEYLHVSEYLRSRGFHHYEVSNFALPGFESRHNRKYWRGKSVAALGPTGTGYFALDSERAYRYKWKPARAEVEEEMLGSRELSLESLYLRLRLSDAFAASSEIPLSLLTQWQERGLAKQDSGAWRMTPQGWVVLDSLMDELFRL